MLITSFATTAIAIGVAVWMWRQRCRLYGRNLALGLANAELRRHVADAERKRDALMLLARTMGGIIKQMGDDIDMLLEPEWELSQHSGEVN
jgi:hypothetical protein